MDTKCVTLTVVTPAYNRGATLPNLYQSLKNQTTKEFIWLVVDDGSTDNTEALVMGYQEDASFPIDFVKKKEWWKAYGTECGHRKGRYRTLFYCRQR